MNSPSKTTHYTMIVGSMPVLYRDKSTLQVSICSFRELYKLQKHHDLQVFSGKWIEADIVKVTGNDIDIVTLSNGNGLVTVSKEHELYDAVNYPCEFDYLDTVTTNGAFALGIIYKYKASPSCLIAKKDIDKFTTGFEQVFDTGKLVTSLKEHECFYELRVFDTSYPLFLDQYFDFFTDGISTKIPTCILNAVPNVINEFFGNPGVGPIQCDSTLEAAGVYYCFTKLGYKVSFVNPSMLYIDYQYYSWPLSICEQLERRDTDFYDCDSIITCGIGRLMV